MTKVCCMCFDLRLYETKMTWNNVFDKTLWQFKYVPREMTLVYSIFDVLFLVCMKQCVRWNTIAVKPSEKAVNSRVCESKLHGKSICLFLWGLMSCGFSSRQNDYSCTVYQKWESWPCLVTFHCSWNDTHNRDLWRYQVWYVFLCLSFY